MLYVGYFSVVGNPLSKTDGCNFKGHLHFEADFPSLIELCTLNLLWNVRNLVKMERIIK